MASSYKWYRLNLGKSNMHLGNMADNAIEGLVNTSSYTTSIYFLYPLLLNPVYIIYIFLQL